MRGYGEETRHLRIVLEIRKENGNGWDTSSEGTEEADPVALREEPARKRQQQLGGPGNS